MDEELNTYEVANVRGGHQTDNGLAKLKLASSNSPEVAFRIPATEVLGNLMVNDRVSCGPAPV